MDRAVNYMVQRIEERYYQTSGMPVAQDSCMMLEKLECNCISGLIINYMSYFIQDHIERYNAKFGCKNDTFYVEGFCDDNPIFPILHDDAIGYLMGERMCTKQGKDASQAYVPFRKYMNMDSLGQEIAAYEKQICLGQDKLYHLEFWISFSNSMRTQGIGINNRAFLAMTIFMQPNKTLKLIKNAIVNGYINKNSYDKLIGFLDEYLDFIKKLLECNNEGFILHFSAAFEKLVGVYFGDFLEDIIKYGDGVFLLESLQKVYRNNLEEIKRRKGLFKGIHDELKKKQKNVAQGTSGLSNLGEKIKTVQELFLLLN